MMPAARTKRALFCDAFILQKRCSVPTDKIFSEQRSEPALLEAKAV
jgi:hypothetical protein